MDAATFFEASGISQPSDTWGRMATPTEGATKGAVDGLHTADTNSGGGGEI